MPLNTGGSRMANAAYKKTTQANQRLSKDLKEIGSGTPPKIRSTGAAPPAAARPGAPAQGPGPQTTPTITQGDRQSGTDPIGVNRDTLVGNSNTPGTLNRPSPALTTSSFNGSSFQPNGTDPWTGFAGQFKPDDFMRFANDPGLLANAAMSGQGYNPGGALGGSLSDTARTMDPLVQLYGLLTGGMTPEGYVNTQGDLLGQQMTVGGRDIDYRELLGRIFSGSQGGDSPLNALFTQHPSQQRNLTPEEQTQIVMSTLGQAGLGMTDLTQRAYMSLLGKGSQDWRQSLLGDAQGSSPDFITYLRDSGLLQGLM